MREYDLVFYAVLSQSTLSLEQRKYIMGEGDNKIRYLPDHQYFFFKQRKSMERLVKKEILLGNRVQAWGIDLESLKVIKLKIEIEADERLA